MGPPDARSIICQLVPENRGAEPTAATIPEGPNIQESSGNQSPTRTYQDLLSNPHDEALFEYYATAQLAIIDSDSSSGEAVKPIGTPQIYAGASISPDGQSLLVTKIQKPFSYLMTYRSFPQKIQVWDLAGQLQYEVADVPMAENIPIEGVRTGPRSVSWKPGHEATLVWMEALDGGDPNQSAERRDRFMVFSAPFKGQPRELLKVEHRGFGLDFMQDPSVVISTEYDRDRRWVRALMHDLKQPGTTPRVLMDMSIRDRYGDPGRMMTRPDAAGDRIVIQDGDWVYRTGQGASKKGNLPFIDRQNLRTLETERLWRCEEGNYESVVALVSSNSNRLPVVITSRENPTTPTNYFMVDLNDGSETAITDFEDPTPQIRDIKKTIGNLSAFGRCRTIGNFVFAGGL